MAKIVIYSTPTCPHCLNAKAYFEAKGLAYVEYDVSQDQARAKEMITKSGQMGVPVIMIDDQMMVGFNQLEIEKLLKFIS